MFFYFDLYILVFFPLEGTDDINLLNIIHMWQWKV